MSSSWIGLSALLSGCVLLALSGVRGQDAFKVMKPEVCDNLKPDNIMLAMASLEMEELAFDRFADKDDEDKDDRAYEDVYGEFAFFNYEDKLLISGYLQGLNTSKTYALRVHKGKTDDLKCEKADQMIEQKGGLDIGNLGIIDVFINETAVFCLSTEHMRIGDEAPKTGAPGKAQSYDLADETSMMVVELPTGDTKAKGDRVVCGSIMPIKEIDMMMMDYPVKPSNITT